MQKFDAFILSCKNGHLEIAQRLQLLGVDIHEEEDIAFRESCDYGHINVVKWLYFNGNVNVRVYNDEAFKNSCNMNRIEVANFLCSIISSYHIEIENDIIIKYSIDGNIISI